MNQENRISINLLFGLYLVYVVFLSIVDMLNLVLFYLDKNTFIWLSTIIAAVVVMIILFLNFKHFKIIPIKLDVLFVSLSSLLLILAFFRGIRPDVSYDVGYYHVFWQYPGFQNNTEYNVFPATFLFPLSDRLFYYPRMLLGYRMGTLLNGFIVVIIYSQVRQILNKLCGSKITVLHKEWSHKSIFNPLRTLGKVVCSESFFAFFAVTTFYTILELGTYMVDICVLPILLALLQIQLDNKFKTKLIEFIYFTLLCGLAMALKITNIFFVLPMIAVFFWKKRKYLHFYTFITCFVAAVIPAAPYLIYNYTSVGNPMGSSMLNSIFKSPYFTNILNSDLRWGPQNYQELFLWPIKLIVDPRNHVSEMSLFPQIFIFVGCIASIGILIENIIKKAKTLPEENSIAIVFLVSTYLWLETSGYPRYAIFCEVLAVILAMVVVIKFLFAQHWKIIKKILALILTIGFVAQCATNTYYGFLNYYDFSWRGKITSSSSFDNYVQDIKYVFQDRGLIGTKEQQEKVDLFLSSNLLHEYAKLINPSAPIVNFETIYKDYAATSGFNYFIYYMDRVRQDAAAGKKIYDLVLPGDYPKICDTANIMGTTVTDMEFVRGNGLSVLMVKYDFLGKQNTLTDLYLSPQIFTIDADKNKSANVSGIAFIAPFVTWSTPSTHFTVNATDGTTTVELFNVDIVPQQIYNISAKLDLSPFHGIVKITVSDPVLQDWHTNAINVVVDPSQ